MSAKNQEYFIRHTAILDISPKDFQGLFQSREFGIHFTSNFSDLTQALEEETYQQSEGKTAIRYLKELAENGGFVWCEYANVNSILIGEVTAGSQIFLKKFTATRNSHSYPNGELVLKCLKLTRWKEIQPDELLALRARRPRQGTFVHWRKSFNLVERALNHDLPLPVNSWQDLTPDLQEIVTHEYLRDVGVNGVRIDRLLMPIGRTMKAVDIYALSTAGKSIFVQVTNYAVDDKESADKIQALKDCGTISKSSELIYVHSGPNASPSGNIHFLSSTLIWDWLAKKPEYRASLFR
jgi:hypothetical protein